MNSKQRELRVRYVIPAAMILNIIPSFFYPPLFFVSLSLLSYQMFLLIEGER